ncbi:hypothetical protein V8G54_031924 [Vigna mungo]|uniref:Uncharacterized protein n=1 Tax=Vigna mungo TaxID=3915 RepID=A0AAQ3MKD4_VIGMU
MNLRVGELSEVVIDAEARIKGRRLRRALIGLIKLEGRLFILGSGDGESSLKICNLMRFRAKTSVVLAMLCRIGPMKWIWGSLQLEMVISDFVFSLQVSNGLMEKKIDDDEFGCGTKSLSAGYIGHGGNLPLLMVHEEDDDGSEA